MLFEKLILSVPLYNDTETVYNSKWNRRFEKDYKLNKNIYTDEELSNFKWIALGQNPNFHKYNDILGYADLTLDSPDILIYYHLNGDGRKIYNKLGSKSQPEPHPLRSNRSHIYPAVNHIQGDTFRDIYNNSIRHAIENSLNMVEVQCEEWNVCTELYNIREKVKYFDFKGYFKDKNWL
jgi:hypothetical protein